RRDQRRGSRIGAFGARTQNAETQSGGSQLRGSLCGALHLKGFEMLVLSGKADDKFFIGEGYVQIIEASSNGTVRLGFTFPGEIAVDRECVRRRKEADPEVEDLARL